jgi:low temperature requirement protein LtrA
VGARLEPTGPDPSLRQEPRRVDRRHPAEPLVEFEQRVTSLELFFDLVFVFAITQVTAMLAADPSWVGLGRGLLVLSALSVHTLNPRRLDAAVVLVAMIPLAMAVSALLTLTLALVAGVLAVLIAYEAIHFVAARDRVRRPDR